MHSVSLVAAATALMATVVVAKCTLDGRECEWFGTSPACGTPDSEPGSFDKEDREYYTSTKYLGWSDLCTEPIRGKSPGSDCCNTYGARCWGGYKRLWCKRAEPDFLDDNNCFKVTYDWGVDGTGYCPPKRSCQRGEEEWTYEYTCGRTCYSHLGKWGWQVKSGDCDAQDKNCRVATSGAVDNIECVKRGIKRELTLADQFEKTDATQWDIYGKQGVFVRMGSGVLATKAPGSKAILNFTSKHDPDTRWSQGILTKGARDANVHDFVFATNLTFPVKSEPVNAGLVFRVSNPGHGLDEYQGYYTGIEWAGVGSAARLVLGAADNNWRHISAADLGLVTKSSFAIKVEAVGPLIKIFVDDVEKPLIEVDDQTFKRGRVGLRTFEVQVKYSDIEFKRIRD